MLEIKLHRIENLIVIPTYACSLNCSYCYTVNLPRISLTKEKLLQVFDEFGIQRLQSALLIGGEPLEAPTIFDLLDLLNQIVTKDISVLTNGHVYNKLYKLLQYDKVLVVLPLVFSNYRSWKQKTPPVEQILEEFKQSYNKFQFKFTLGKHDLKNFDEIFDRILELRLAGINATVGGVGYGFGVVSQQEADSVFLQILSVLYKEVELALANPTYAPIFQRYIGNLLPMKHLGCICNTGRSLTVLPDGSVSLCDSPQHHEKIKFDSERRVFLRSDLRTCETCKFLQFCRGSCISSTQYEINCFVRLSYFINAVLFSKKIGLEVSEQWNGFLNLLEKEFPKVFTFVKEKLQ